MNLAKSKPNIDVIHIGNTGSRCQFPVYKVCALDKEFTVTPAKRQVTYIFEINLNGFIKRRVVEVKDNKSIDYLLNKVDAFYSKAVNASTARSLQGGAA